MHLSTARAALLASAAFIAAPASAATLYSDLAAWQAAAGPSFNTTALGVEFENVTSVSLVGGGSLGFDQASILTLGNGWQTWPGGYTGQVLFPGETPTTITFGGLTALGFEAQPDPFSVHDITVTLSDGSVLTQAVDGNSGARFFGFVGAGIASVTISSDVNFAYGNIWSSLATPVPVPVAPAMALFGLALAGLALARRRV